MVSETLTDQYKKSIEKKGFSRTELRELLLKSGWDQTSVTKYLKKEFKNLEPKKILRVESISKTFNKNIVLDNVDFDIREGEILGLIGVSGAGKTTLLNMIVGFYQPDSGDILYALPDGTTANIKTNPDAFKRFFGFSTQTPSFYPSLTVNENLEYFASLYHLLEPKKSRKCTELLKLVDLEKYGKIIANNLSGGMQKRLDVACALIHEPKVLILDEPTADLDPILRKKFWDIVKKINKTGASVIISSHFLHEIEFLCSRIAILHKHKIAELDTVEKLKNIYSKNFEIKLKTKSKKLSKLTSFLSKHKKTFSKLTISGDELTISVHEPQKILQLITDFFKNSEDKITDLNLSKPSLGEIFEVLIEK